MSVSLSLFALYVVCCCVLLCVVCVVVGLCVLLWWWLWMWLCVCVSSCLALKNALVCTFKTLPYVLSKRPRHSGHGRFEGTHGSVFIVHTASLPLFSSLSLFSHLFFSVSFHLSFFSSLSITLSITMTMIARPVSYLYTRP